MFEDMLADEDLTAHGVAVRNITRAISVLEMLASQVSDDLAEELESVIDDLETALAALEEV